MKKHLLIIGALALLANDGIAQTWSENFNGGIPATWTLINNDNKTPDGNVSFVNKAWVTRQKTDASGAPIANDSIIVSTSWYSPAGIADDWIITPAFTVNDANTLLGWEERAFDATYADGYEVRVSETGNAIADFTTVLNTTTAANSNGFLKKGASLSAFNGKTIYIAFRNNSNDKFLLGLDNIATEVAAGANDATVRSVVLPKIGNAFIVENGNTVKVAIENKGTQAITSLDLQYAVDGGTPVTQSFTGLNIGIYGKAEISFSTPVASLTQGNHAITIEATQVNGQTDVNTSDNTASANFIVPSQNTPKACLIEEFSSSTCVPCASFNAVFDPLANDNNANIPATNFNLIKYQMNWPSPGNDASYNAHGVSRRSYYGVNSIPDHYTNGLPGKGGDQTEIDGCKGGPAYMAIDGTYTVTGDEIIADVTVNPYLTVSGNFKVHIAVVEKDYYNNAATTTQKHYVHVMRRMFPNGDGTAVTNWTSGTPTTYHHSAKFAIGDVKQNTYNFWTHPKNSNLVVFVQDNDTKEIVQSKVIVAQWPTNVQDAQNNIQQVLVFPNPANDQATVAFNLAKAGSVKMEVIDAVGRVVYTAPAQSMTTGLQQINIPTAGFANGLYTIKVQTEGGNITERLSVVK